VATDTVLVNLPTSDGVITITIVALSLDAKSPSEHVTIPLMFEQVPTVELAETKAAPAGKGSVTTTAKAVPGPRLVTTIVFVNG